jgi:hypothetical protein
MAKAYYKQHVEQYLTVIANNLAAETETLM